MVQMREEHDSDKTMAMRWEKSSFALNVVERRVPCKNHTAIYDPAG